MEISIKCLQTQIIMLFQDIFEYFKGSPVSTIFFVFLLFTFLLNLTQKILIQIEKRRETSIQKCKYLDTDNHKQYCKLQSYREYFIENGDSCVGCSGHFIEISDTELEKRIEKRSIWKHIIILLANISRNLLPYISFFYTLSVTIFEK